MSARRVGQPSVVFAPSTIYLDFPRSDGDETKWPSNTIYDIDSDGQVNFMEHLDIDQSGQVKKWRAAIGKAIATKLEMQGDPNNYVLRNWPASYRMYDHHKGPAGNPRHDLYLYGCARGRFRSINEFIPHAIWLFNDSSMNYANCECKYCTKQPQKGITASMGDILGTPTSVSPAPRVRREKREKAKANRPFVSVQRALKPALKPSAHVQDSPTLAERNSDLRAAFSRNSMKLKRWYRDGEIVWCELRPPIPGPTGEDSSIRFWPGLVQEYKLKAVPVPREEPPASTDTPPNPPNPKSGTFMTGSAAYEEGRGLVFEKAECQPFTVEQSTVYLVEWFGVNKSVHVSDQQVIPYQAYLPSDDLILAMQAIAPELLFFDRDSVSNFNPAPGNQTPSFEDAAGPYAVALQIASNTSQFFSVTDEWEFSYTIPGPSTSSTQTQPDNSLHSAINAASRLNAVITATVVNSQSPHLYRNLSSAQPDISQPQLEKLTNEILGAPNPARLNKTQIRFQGLWWGPERIWVDDFVRLKVLRRCLAPHGSQDISPPGGPGKKTIEAYQSPGRDLSELGAGSRGVFMRIDALFVMEYVSDGRKKKECRASGPLFELVDEDWDENEDPGVKEHASRLRATVETSRPTNPPPARAVSSPATQQPSASVPAAPTLASTSAPSIAQSQPSPAALSSSKSPRNPITSPNAPPAHYLPPLPPLGFRFRPILTPGYEAVVSLSLLSGRYYPGLIMHPLVVAEMTRAARIHTDAGGILKYGHIWALDGLNGGFHCNVDPDKFQSSRTRMLERADKEAYISLETYKRQAIAGEMDDDVDNDEGEDVDMLARDDDMSEGGLDRDGDVSMD